MTRRLIPVLSLAAVVWAAPARAADDDPKAIVTRAIKAHGGEEPLAKLPGIEIRAKGKLKLPGVGEVDFTQHALAMPPDKIKEELELTVMGQNVTVRTIANGDTISIVANGQDVPVPDEAKTALKDAGYMMRVARLVPLVREKGFELSLYGDAKVEGKPAVGVRVTHKGQKDITLFFDKETGLVVKVERRTIAPGGDKEVTEERILQDYGKKDGIAVPKKVLIKHDGDTFMTAEVQELAYLEKIADDEFKK